MKQLITHLRSNPKTPQLLSSVPISALSALPNSTAPTARPISSKDPTPSATKHASQDTTLTISPDPASGALTIAIPARSMGNVFHATQPPISDS